MLAVIAGAVLAANTVVVTAIIDKDKEKVTFIGSQPGLPVEHTFVVETGDTLKWQLRDVKGNSPADLGEFRARVKFSKFPKEGGKHQPLLLVRGRSRDTLEAKGGVISGTVNKAAPRGDYFYDLELVSPAKTIRLKCFWAKSADDPAPIPTSMAGGNRGGGAIAPPPPNP